jgi:hypothetical protein
MSPDIFKVRGGACVSDSTGASEQILIQTDSTKSAIEYPVYVFLNSINTIDRTGRAWACCTVTQKHGFLKKNPGYGSGGQSVLYSDEGAVTE